MEQKLSYGVRVHDLCFKKRKKDMPQLSIWRRWRRDWRTWWGRKTRREWCVRLLVFGGHWLDGYQLTRSPRWGKKLWLSMLYEVHCVTKRVLKLRNKFFKRFYLSYLNPIHNVMHSRFSTPTLKIYWQWPICGSLARHQLPLILILS